MANIYGGSSLFCCEILLLLLPKWATVNIRPFAKKIKKNCSASA